jgi:hypothetical protein
LDYQDEKYSHLVLNLLLLLLVSEIKTL